MSDAVVIGYLDLDQRQPLCSLKPQFHLKPLCTVSQSEKPNGVTSFEVIFKVFLSGWNVVKGRDPRKPFFSHNLLKFKGTDWLIQVL